MKPTHLIPAFVALALAAQPAAAACYADYKAKRDTPLKLHYGVMDLPDRVCDSVEAAEPVVAARLDEAGWELLNVLSVFGEEGLEQRKDSAGKFFLRF